jgi:hypothetical protein
MYGSVMASVLHAPSVSRAEWHVHTRRFRCGIVGAITAKKLNLRGNVRVKPLRTHSDEIEIESKY